MTAKPNTVIRFALGCALTFTILGAIGCVPTQYSREEEIARLISPDGRVIAVVTRKGGGATVSTCHSLYLIPTNGLVNPKGRVLVAIEAKDLAVKWVAARHLQVEYTWAAIREYQNFWHLPSSIDSGLYTVEIAETPKGSGSALPPDYRRDGSR